MHQKGKRLRQGSLRLNKEENVWWNTTVAAESGWNEPALKTAFWQGLNADVLTEFPCKDSKASLDKLIDLAIKLDRTIDPEQDYLSL